jgi:hypothetical protein
MVAGPSSRVILQGTPSQSPEPPRAKRVKPPPGPVGVLPDKAEPPPPPAWFLFLLLVKYADFALFQYFSG